MTEGVGSVEVAAAPTRPSAERRSGKSVWGTAGAAFVSAASCFASLQANVTGPASVHQQVWIAVAALAAGAGGAGASLGAQQVLKLWTEHSTAQGAGAGAAPVRGGSQGADGSPTPQPPPVRLIPPFRRLFVDRTDGLAWIARELAVPGDGLRPRSVALIGLSGVGKTRLALEYAARFQARYDVVAWVAADDQAQIVGALHSLAVELDVLPQATTAETVRLVWWALARRRRWLLIFDSTVDEDSLLPWWPTAANGEVIVTSTRRGWSQFVDAQYTLDGLAPDYGAELLCAIDERADADSARVIAERLGGLPLELTRAASYAAAASLPLSKAVSGRGGTVRESAHSWIAELSVLEADAPLAYSLLRLIARTAPSSIPRSLLSAAVADSIAADGDADAALAELAGRSLIELDEHYATVHPRYQEVVREHLDADRGASAADCARLMEALLAALPARIDNANAAGDYAALAPHALAVLGSARRVGAEPGERFTLALRIGHYLHLRDQLEAAERVVQEALGDAALLPAPANALAPARAVAQAHAQTELSEIRFHHADLVGAKQAGDQALECARGAGDDTALCMALLAIAQVEREQEQYPSALERYREAAVAAAGDSRLATRVLADQGLLEWRMGELEDALNDSLRACELYRADDGPDSADAARALDAAGLAARDLGRTGYAVELLQEAAAVFEGLFGPLAQESTLKAREHLGSALLADGRAAEAGSILESVLALREEMLGSDHPNISEACHYLGEVRLRTGQYDEAATYAARSRRIRAALLGADHRYTREADDLLARIDAARGARPTP